MSNYIWNKHVLWQFQLYLIFKHLQVTLWGKSMLKFLKFHPHENIWEFSEKCCFSQSLLNDVKNFRNCPYKLYIYCQKSTKNIKTPYIQKPCEHVHVSTTWQNEHKNKHTEDVYASLVDKYLLLQSWVKCWTLFQFLFSFY